MSPPFVVKVVSPDILHKSDAGGVKVGLTDHAAVSEAVQDMAAIPAIASANVEGYLVEEMAPAGQEIVIGGLNDSQFGPMVMVGLGGVFVETLKDVAFRLCPISEVDAHAMLAELKGKAILEGARGSQAVSLDAIVKALLNVGGKDGLMHRYGNDIEELDINPLIVNAESAVAVDARVILSAKPELKATAQTNDAVPPIERFRPLFEPKTIAVIGASTTNSIIANTFIRRMKAYGYDGDIYPIHPKADKIEGLKAYPDLGQTPKPIDYAYVATRADRIPDMIGAAKGNVKFAQVISSGFREVDEGVALEADLLRQAKAAGCRVIGPNCLGLYSPRGKVTFPVDAPKDLGTVGVVTQSGGLGTDIIKRGQWRGLRFSGFLTVGNCADIGPADMLEFYLADPETTVIGFYLEDIGDGRRFFELLRLSETQKPVVILKGGRSELRPHGSGIAYRRTRRQYGRLAGIGRTDTLYDGGDGRCVRERTSDTPAIDGATVATNRTGGALWQWRRDERSRDRLLRRARIEDSSLPGENTRDTGSAWVAARDQHRQPDRHTGRYASTRRRSRRERNP